MIVILVAVIWSMRQLNLGKSVAVAASGTEFGLCPTRMLWVEAGGAHLEEHSRKWMMTLNNGPMHEIDGAEAERWFSRLCSAKLEVVEAAEDKGEFKPAMKLGYVTGPSADVLIGPTSDIFKLGDHTFRSPEVAEVLRTLPTLPEAAKPGHP